MLFDTEKYLETLFGHDIAFEIHLFKIVFIFQTNSLTLVLSEMYTSTSVVWQYRQHSWALLKIQSYPEKDEQKDKALESFCLCTKFDSLHSNVRVNNSIEIGLLGKVYI